MANAVLSTARTFISFREKRRFNWIVLALLLVVVLAGAAAQVMEIL
jgi:hypothetical protein